MDDAPWRMRRRAGWCAIAAIGAVALAACGAETGHEEADTDAPAWTDGAVVYAAVEGLRGEGFDGVETQLAELEELGIDAVLLWPPIVVRAAGVVELAPGTASILASDGAD
jgi:hypothetical protein